MRKRKCADMEPVDKEEALRCRMDGRRGQVGEEEAEGRDLRSSSAGSEQGEKGEEGESDVMTVKDFLDLMKGVIMGEPQTNRGGEAVRWLSQTFTIMWEQPVSNIVQLCRSLPSLKNALESMNIIFPTHCEAGFMECVHVAGNLARVYNIPADVDRGLILGPSVRFLVQLSMYFGTVAESPAWSQSHGAERAIFSSALFRWKEGAAMDIEGLTMVLGNIGLWTTDRNHDTVYIPENLLMQHISPAVIPILVGELHHYFYKNAVGSFRFDGGHLPSFGLWHAWATRACLAKESSFATAHILCGCRKYGLVPLRCVLSWFPNPDAVESFFINYFDPPRYVNGPLAYSLFTSVVEDFVPTSAWTTQFLSSVAEAPQVTVYRGPIVYTLDVNRNVLKSLQCPISLEAMDHPRVTPTGHVFDGPTIVQWLEHSSQNPITRMTLNKEDLTTCSLLTILCNTTKEAVTGEQHGQCYLTPPTASLFFCAESGEPLGEDVVVGPGGKIYNRQTIPKGMAESDCIHCPTLQTVLDNLVYIYPKSGGMGVLRESELVPKRGDDQQTGGIESENKGAIKGGNRREVQAQRRWYDDDMAAVPVTHFSGSPGGPELFVMDLTEASDSDYD